MNSVRGLETGEWWPPKDILESIQLDGHFVDLAIETKWSPIVVDSTFLSIPVALSGVSRSGCEVLVSIQTFRLPPRGSNIFSPEGGIVLLVV